MKTCHRHVFLTAFRVPSEQQNTGYPYGYPVFCIWTHLIIQGCKSNDSGTSDMMNSLLNHIERWENNGVFLCTVIVLPGDYKTNFCTLHTISLTGKHFKLFLCFLGQLD